MRPWGSNPSEKESVDRSYNRFHAQAPPSQTSVFDFGEQSALKSLPDLIARLADSLGQEQATSQVRAAYSRMIAELVQVLPLDERASFLEFCSDCSRAWLDQLAAEPGPDGGGSVDPEPTVMVPSPLCGCGHRLSAHRAVFHEPQAEARSRAAISCSACGCGRFEVVG